MPGPRPPRHIEFEITHRRRRQAIGRRHQYSNFATIVIPGKIFQITARIGNPRPANVRRAIQIELDGVGNDCRSTESHDIRRAALQRAKHVLRRRAGGQG